MTVFDRQRVIEDAAKLSYAAHFRNATPDPVELAIERDGLRAALPFAVAGALKPIREQVAEWREFMRDPDLTGYERSAIRMCASEMERLLDQIEADVKGGER